jgi:hypothetical protein
VTCASVNGLLILSGAFGLFRRDAVIAVGGLPHRDWETWT